MSLEEAILDAVRALPADKQQEVLAHVKHLREESQEPRKPRKSGRGLWEDLNIDLSAEDIDEARREMWKDFPRNDF
jgi:putative lipoic acid-binding regulatory protein